MKHHRTIKHTRRAHPRPQDAAPATTDAEAPKKPERKKRVLSGVQPTGSIHLGNYFGAIKNWVGMQEEFDAFYCVVDLHAITAGGHDPKELMASTRSSAAIYLAAGRVVVVVHITTLTHTHTHVHVIYPCS